MSVPYLRQPWFLITCLFSFLAPATLAADLTAQLPSRLSNIKAGNQQIVLLGTEVQQGQTAPAFKVVDDNFKTVTLDDYRGKTLLISVIPSVDTGTCSLQTRRFNQEAASISEQVVLLTISTDLPFAQRRYCQQEGIENMAVLSDAVWRDFGSNYGLLIKDMGLLARAVLIIDKTGKLVYQQHVPQLSQEPDYQDAMTALNQIMSK